MSLRQDVTYAARLLWRSPLFTLTAVLSLAIGIAGNAAVFSIADALFLKPRPGIAAPERLVDIGRTTNGEGFDNMSFPNYLDLRDRSTLFEGIAAYRDAPQAVGLGVDGGADRVYAGQVAANYFDVLGVPMALGRGFQPDEDRPPAGAAVVVLGYDMWQRRFDGNPDVIGRTVTLSRQPYTVVGVAAEGFTGNSLPTNDLWVPLSSYPAGAGSLEMMARALFAMRQGVWLQAVGRLKPEVTVAQARAQLQQISRDLEREYPDTNRAISVAVQPSSRVPGEMQASAAGFVSILFALVGIILLIACANIGGMLLARGAGRAREVATRLALGAARTRVVRQLVIESLLIAGAGAGLGVAGSLALVTLLQSLVPTLPMPVTLDLEISWRVIAFSTAVAASAGILAGLLPALQAAGTDLLATMRWDSWNRAPSRLRQAFVVAQIALSVLLIVGALLLGRSLSSASRIDPGFTIANLDVVQLDFRLAGYDDAGGQRVGEDLMRRVAQLPAVRAVSTTWVLPLTDAGGGLGPLWPAGQPRDPRTSIAADWNVIGPDYFETMGTAIVRGRDFTGADRQGGERVAIVSELFARRAWPDRDPVGQRLAHMGFVPGQSPVESELVVVGVARDVRFRSLGADPRPFIYVPTSQQPGGIRWLVARTTGPSAIPDIRRLVAEIDSNVPVVEASTLETVAAAGLAPTRIAAWLATGVGTIGLFLAALGIYGITAYTVSQRTREIGVRVALGALSRDVLRLIIGGGMRLAAIGIVLGALGAAGAAQLLTSLLYGIEPIDAVSFLGGTLVFAVIALLACLIPGRRAMGLNPVDALRSE